MATSSSTTFGGPPSPLEKAIRKTTIFRTKNIRIQINIGDNKYVTHTRTNQLG